VALTATQKASVRRYLGYPDVNREPHHNLEGALVALSAEGEAIVIDILAKLATLDTRLESRQATQGIKRAEEVEFFETAGLTGLWMEGRRLVEQLAALLDVQIRRQIYGPGGGTAGPAGRG